MGDIIENSKLVSQGPETKNRGKYKLWTYMYDNIEYKGNTYSLIMDVASMGDGENHYRLQRLELKENTKKQGTKVGALLKIITPCHLTVRLFRII